MQIKYNRFLLAAVSATLTAALLFVVNYVPKSTLLLGERLFPGVGGVLQLLIVSFYSALLTYKMLDRESRKKWRLFSWLLFSSLFYSQLLLGIVADSIFLLTGKLHLPIPAIILAGPLYRFSSWFMIFLFLSTIILSGPAWCSHLCYFGAWDALSAQRLSNKRVKLIRTLSKSVKQKLKLSSLIVFVLVALLMRIFNAGPLLATTLGIAAGMFGLLIILFYSRKKGVMAHCSLYCPIGTIVNHAKKISPFRFELTSNCTMCNACVSKCSYMALTPSSIAKREIEPTCTYCGDCLPACNHDGLQYRFGLIKGERAENIWIVTTVVLHSLFLAIARI